MTYDVRTDAEALAELEALKQTAIAEANGTTNADPVEPIEEVAEETEEIATPEVEEETEEESEEVPETPKVEETDKEKKKRLYAKLNQTIAENERLKKEREELKARTDLGAYDADTLETLRAVVRQEILDSEINNTWNSERKEFIAKAQVDARSLADIEEIKSAHPTLSYEAAHKLYLAYNPDLIPQERKKQAPIMKWGSPATAPKPSDANDLERRAREEFKKMMAG